MKKPHNHIIFMLILVSSITGLWLPSTAEPGSRVESKQILGWVERIAIVPWDLTMKAKLDTGAKTSSIHAENITRFKKDGDDWVRFDLEVETDDDDDDGDKKRVITIEREVVRNIRVKRHGAKSQRRAVVRIKICVNGKIHEPQFSLTNRDKFLYPVLLGRRFLNNFALVDPSETFVTSPRCSND